VFCSNLRRACAIRTEDYYYYYYYYYYYRPQSLKETAIVIPLLSQSQSHITTDSQPALLGVMHPSGTRDQFFFLLEIFFRQLRVCYFVAPSLTRGRVRNLLLLLVFASVVPLGSESRGTHDSILLSQFLRLPQPGGPGPRIYIPQKQGCPDIPPGTGFPFRRLLRLVRLRWRYSISPPHGKYPY
jgi:hypothetical protein